MDLYVIALSRFKRQKYDAALDLCNKMLQNNPNDQQAWILKCHSLIRKHYLDDLEMDEENAGDLLLDENSMTSVARPGTSFSKPLSSKDNPSNPNPVLRPVSKGGRGSTGYARTNTNRPTTSSQGMKVQTALRGSRMGTNRAVTSGGRHMRLATVSLAQSGEVFILPDKLNIKSLAKKKALAKAICDYFIYVEPNLKKALELAVESTLFWNYQDWWWKERLGKIYYLLGMLRESESQLSSSIKQQDMIRTRLQLARVAIRMDQPLKAIDLYKEGIDVYPSEINFPLAIGRVYDQLNDSSQATDWYRKSLKLESCNFEAIANLAAFHFYTDQPEIALRFYKRLIQLGIGTPEIWCNLGLCTFFNGQYDLFWGCFERAISVCNDDVTRAEIWFNISHVFIHLGELFLALQALKICISLNVDHKEAYNNLAVLELKRGNFDEARYFLESAIKAEHLFEPFYNSALVSFKGSDFQQSLSYVKKSLAVYPDHEESKQLLSNLELAMNSY